MKQTATSGQIQESITYSTGTKINISLVKYTKYFFQFTDSRLSHFTIKIKNPVSHSFKKVLLCSLLF